MENYLRPEYWNGITVSARVWLQDEVLVLSSLLELFSLLAALALGWLAARPVKVWIIRYIEGRDWRHNSLGRLVYSFGSLSPAIFSVVLLVAAYAAFRHFGIPARIVKTAASLLGAWVFIRLLTSMFREPNTARFIAVAAWTVAALNILSLLAPTLALLDSLAVQFGDVRISILLLIKAIVLLALLLRLALGAAGLLEKRIRDFKSLTPSIQVLLSKALKITLLVTAVLATLSSLGINLTAFAFFGGAIGVGIGFGLQKVVSNLVSGLILLLDRSIKPGDVIEVGQTYGRIQSLGARYVSVVTRDNTEYIIPNEDLITNRVINWSYTDKLVRLRIGVGVSYDSDIHEVMRLVTEAAANVPRVLEIPRPVCQLKDFGSSSIDMELRIWIKDPENGISNVSSDVRVALWESFKRHRIQIPFPQRDLHIKRETAETAAG
ncbi:MAG: mechanosensitive ion channel protein MscS [Desulfobacteraceae bacterium]|nr:MAG: mechanosensitive ion channel protein MscS [Desulfobacteraceae bacterium]